MRLTLIAVTFALAVTLNPVCAQTRYALPAGGSTASSAPAVPCKTCSTFEMTGIDPSRLLGNGSPQAVPPPRVKAASHKAHKRHKHKIVAQPAAKTAELITPKPVRRTPAVVHHVVKPKPPCAVVFDKVQALLSAHKDDQAEQYLKESLVRNPHDNCVRSRLTKYLLCQGYFFMKTGEIECGARRLREVLFIDPQNRKATDMLDKCYAASGIDPGDANRMRKVAATLLNQGRNAAAFVEYERLLAAGPNVPTYLGYGLAAQRLGQTSTALTAYQQALKLDPYDNNAWRQLGQLQAQLGNVSAAQDAFGNALQIEPADVLAGDGLINLCQSRLGAAPNDPSLHLALAKAWMLVGQPGSAASEFSTISSLTGNELPWQQAIADARSQRGAWQRQTAAIKQIVLDRKNQKPVEDFLNAGPSPVSARIPAAKASIAASTCPCD